MSSRLVGFALAALLSAGAFGQNSVSVTSAANGFRGSAHFPPLPPVGIRPITGAPYSGEEFSEMVQTLADGTHITRTMPAAKVYRDSAGRTRTERPMFQGPVGLGSNAPDSPILVEIRDPVAQVRYILDTQNKIAHRQELPAAGTRWYTPGAATGRGAVGASVAPIVAGGGGGSAGAVVGQILTGPPPNVAGQATNVPRPQVTTEKLQAQTIEGVPVEGTRQTLTWPVRAQGNDRPITSMSETWMSPELQVVVLSKMSDPRSGEHTQRLINISRSEPDPSLFQPLPITLWSMRRQSSRSSGVPHTNKA